MRAFLCVLLVAVALGDGLTPIEAQEARLAKETTEIGEEVAVLEANATSAGATTTGAPSGAAAAAASFGVLVTCQKAVQTNVQASMKFKGQADACAAKLAKTQLAVVANQRQVTAAETQRAKAKLTETQALQAMRDAFHVRRNETLLKELGARDCALRKKQLSEAVGIAESNAAQAKALAEAKRKGSLALAAARASDDKLTALTSADKQTLAETLTIRKSIAAFVKQAKATAADEVKNIQADIALKLKAIKSSFNITAQEAALESAASINATKAQAKIAVDAAIAAKSAALSELPQQEVALKKAADALKTAEDARAKAVTDLANLKAWTKNQLASALRAVRRAATAAKNVAGQATQVKAGATLIGSTRV